MWGGRATRNAVSSEPVPTEWDVGSGQGVRWTAALGSQTYGNPVVAAGKVFVGTNNEALYDPEEAGDRGVLIAFDESDGRFLWQSTSPKLEAGQVNDWPYVGICSSPLVVGDRLFYLTSRGEVLALDIEGFRDGENDGPYRDERQTGEIHADIVWRFDLVAELGVFAHNMAASSPVAHDGLLFVGTSNGHDESHDQIPAPEAPALVALRLQDGRLAWRDDSVGDRVLHGQWGSPSLGEIGGVVQLVTGQGDGWVRGLDAASGSKLWEFDTNPHDAVWPKTRNNVIGTPVIRGGRVYVANGQDPERGDGDGHLYGIDASLRGDITETGEIWHYDAIRRSISTAVIAEGIVYASDFSGFLHALDAETGAPLWVHDTFAAIWGSPLLAAGHVYLGDEDGDVVVLRAGREEHVVAEINMGSAIYSTPVAAGGTLFIATRDTLFAIAPP